jgi:hypothetical protein
MSSTNSSRNIEHRDKENTSARVFQGKKEKGVFEEPQSKKIVLGESNGNITIIEEPTSPEDTKLMNRKR